MTTITAIERARNRPAPAALRRLNSRDMRRILARLAELDELAHLMHERPYAGRWSW